MPGDSDSELRAGGAPNALAFDGIECVPIIHGRLAFAVEVRRRLLERSFGAIAVELPPFLKAAIEAALGELPRVTAIAYRQQPDFIDENAPYYVLIAQPADATIEAIRVAERERIPVGYIDCEIENASSIGIVLPDPHAIVGMSLARYYEACLPIVAAHPRSEHDAIREAHMAAKLKQLRAAIDGPILFVCGMAHWHGVRRHLEQSSGVVHDGIDVDPDDVRVLPVHARSLPPLLGEMPYIVGHYEKHRAGFNLEDFEPVRPLKELLLSARRLLEIEDSGTLERPDPQRLRTMLDFLRKMTVRRGTLFPDCYHLTVAAKGVVGNDFALLVLKLANLYPFNLSHAMSDDDDRRWSELVEESCGGAGCDLFTGDDLFGSAASGELSSPDEGDPFGEEELFYGDGQHGVIDGAHVPTRDRLPGTPFTIGRLSLERRPDSKTRKEFRTKWDERMQCSWPPEDLVIENFRDYVGKRALSLARVGQSRTEPFTTSFLDGIDLRETLRDVVERRIHVRDEPRVPGAVGALVIVFEEDEFGEHFPWRTTWMAEHQNESTLAFYATDYKENVIGPGIARANYGGCLLIFPPIHIPDIWDDLRFERARTPSERLLLAGVYWSNDHYLVHVGKRAPRAEVKSEAAARGKHILHLPLSTFSSTTLERLRRVHVLNGHWVRTYAQRFIR